MKRAIPCLSPRLELDEDIAVVGSSRHLFAQELGETIDAHREVVRFNRAYTEGIERHVGTRTTLRYLNSHVLLGIPWPRNPFLSLRDGDIGFSRTLRDQRVIGERTGWSGALGYHLSRLGLYRPVHRSNTLYTPAWESSGTRKLAWCNDVLSRWNLSIDKEPRVGLSFVLMALDAGVRPTLYGFDIETPVLRNYVHKGPTVKTCSWHDIDREGEILRAFLAQGLISVGSDENVGQGLD